MVKKRRQCWLVLAQAVHLVWLLCFAPIGQAASAFITELDKFIESKRRADETPGVVFLVSSPKLGTRTITKGYAVIPPKAVRMTAELPFRVASISKTFLAVMVLKLVEQGKIHLEDSIIRYLPRDIDLRLLPHAKDIHIKHLLTMSSGLPEYYDLDVDAYLALHPYKRWSAKDALEFTQDLKPKFMPGRGFEYSNTNYVVLQMLLKQVTGQNLRANLKELITDPLGLKNTYADDFKASTLTLITHGYDAEKEKPDVSDHDDGFGMGDTFVITTAYDLHRFLSALFVECSLLKAKTVQEMVTPNPFGPYGMGVEITKAKGIGDIYSHNGLVNGFQTNYYFVPNYRLTVIILTNNRATTLIEPVFVKTLLLYKQYYGK